MRLAIPLFLLAAWLAPGAARADSVTLDMLTFDFGVHPAGEPSEPLIVTVRAGAETGAVITSITSSNGAFVVDETNTKRVLSASGRTTFGLIFAPRTTEAQSATIDVYLQGNTASAATMSVTGQGVLQGVVSGISPRGPYVQGVTGCATCGKRSGSLGLLVPLSLMALVLIERRRRRADHVSSR